MTRFEFDPSGLAVILKAPEMAAEMLRRVEKAKVFAEATAPYRASDPPPHYRDQFEVEVRLDGGLNNDRAEGVLRNTDSASFQIEHGTGDTPAHRTLGRSLDAMRD